MLLAAYFTYCSGFPLISSHKAGMIPGSVKAQLYKLNKLIAKRNAMNAVIQSFIPIPRTFGSGTIHIGTRKTSIAGIIIIAKVAFALLISTGQKRYFFELYFKCLVLPNVWRYDGPLDGLIEPSCSMSFSYRPNCAK